MMKDKHYRASLRFFCNLITFDVFFFSHLVVADSVKLIEHGVKTGSGAKELADDQHILVAELLLPGFYEESD